MREERILGRAAATASASSPSSPDPTPASSSAPWVRRRCQKLQTWRDSWAEPSRTFPPSVSGVLLRKLEAGIRGISHVIVDEIHERDINVSWIIKAQRIIMFWFWFWFWLSFTFCLLRPIS